MLQLQLLVPLLNTDATFTANMKREDELEMELKSDIKFMTAVSEQKFKVKYGNSVPFEFQQFSVNGRKQRICVNPNFLPEIF